MRSWQWAGQQVARSPDTLSVTMNHKRKRPKHQRAGCLMCKPHKDERLAKKPKASVGRKLQEDE